MTEPPSTVAVPCLRSSSCALDACWSPKPCAELVGLVGLSWLSCSATCISLWCGAPEVAPRGQQLSALLPCWEASGTAASCSSLGLDFQMLFTCTGRQILVKCLGFFFVIQMVYFPLNTWVKFRWSLSHLSVVSDMVSMCPHLSS